MASILIARSLKEEKKSEEIFGNQPDPRRLEEDGVPVEAETPPQPPAPLPPQQSLPAQPSPLPPLEGFGEGQQEEVVVAERVVGGNEKYEVTGDGNMEGASFKTGHGQGKDDGIKQEQLQHQQQQQSPAPA